MIYYCWWGEWVFNKKGRYLIHPGTGFFITFTNFHTYISWVSDAHTDAEGYRTETWSSSVAPPSSRENRAPLPVGWVLYKGGSEGSEACNLPTLSGKASLGNSHSFWILKDGPGEDGKKKSVMFTHLINTYSVLLCFSTRYTRKTQQFL